MCVHVAAWRLQELASDALPWTASSCLIMPPRLLARHRWMKRVWGVV